VNIRPAVDEDMLSIVAYDEAVVFRRIQITEVFQVGRNFKIELYHSLCSVKYFSPAPELVP
jgi:hypothetical protein